ncbi:MAG: SMC-Scp complex subunit ScpB [Candidatus Bathyarchaeia archaeon]
MRSSSVGPEELALAEAALYAAGRPLSLDRIKSVIRTRSKDRARRVLEILMKRHSRPDTPYEVLELDGDRYVLQLRPRFFERVRSVAKPITGKGTLKTLAYVAFNQPVIQKEVVAARGQHSYAHLGILESLGLIVRERYGRTRMIRTSKAFSDLFGFSHDLRGLKTQLRTLLEKSKRRHRIDSLAGSQVEFTN